MLCVPLGFLLLQAVAIFADLPGLHILPAATPVYLSLLFLALAVGLLSVLMFRKRAKCSVFGLLLGVPSGVVLGILATLVLPRGLESRYPPSEKAAEHGILSVSVDLPGRHTDARAILISSGRQEVTRSREKILVIWLHGGGKVILMGQSFGGALALDALARGRNVDGLVTLSTPTDLGAIEGIPWRELLAFGRKTIYGIFSYGNAWEVAPSFGRINRNRYPVRLAAGLNKDSEENWSYVSEFTKAVTLMDLDCRLTRIERLPPTLIVHGDSDYVVPLNQARQIADCLGLPRLSGTWTMKDHGAPPPSGLLVAPSVGHLDITFHKDTVNKIAAWVSGFNVRFDT